MFAAESKGRAVEPAGMSAIPGSVETEKQPPMTVPLRHFLVALVLLLAGAVVGIGPVDALFPGQAALAHVHLLLAGWVCVTIMGAMTQFVPVWSGVELHSRRLASLQLALVVAGLAVFAGGLLAGAWTTLPAGGALMLAGFWTFVYNIARTLATVEDYDVTERHFAVALAFFLVLAPLGVLLAVDLNEGILLGSGVTHQGVLGAHATVAVFGAVLTTVYGALYQLGTMFTQTELHGIDEPLQRVTEVSHPVGVVLLAGGRLFDVVTAARVGGLAVVLGALAFCAVLGRKLYEMRVEWNPMHTRYAVAVPTLAVWALTAAPAWASEPTRYVHLLGAEGAMHLLVLGAVGFVVLGTLYHIIPFIVWVHRYSDLLGFEEVPMIDDLYDDRLAAADATLLVAGTGLIVAADLFAVPEFAGTAGGTLVALGVVVFGANMLLVLLDHSPNSLDRILLGSFSPRRGHSGEEEDAPARQ